MYKSSLRYSEAKLLLYFQKEFEYIFNVIFYHWIDKELSYLRSQIH